MENTSHVTPAPGAKFVDAHRRPRFKLQTGICVYQHGRPVVRGDTVDISESGISALLREEVSLDEIVRLMFSLPCGEVEIHALVRQRNAFRYGFHFMEAGPAFALVRRACRELEVEQSLKQTS